MAIGRKSKNLFGMLIQITVFSDATEIVWTSMDINDSLIVVDATNNAASWRNLDPEVEEFIKKKWNA